MAQVELKPHVGKSRSGRKVVFKQNLVFFEGRHVGYVGTFEGAPLNLTVRLDPEEVDTIVSFLAGKDKKAGKTTKARRVSMPPKQDEPEPESGSSDSETDASAAGE